MFNNHKTSNYLRIYLTNLGRYYYTYSNQSSDYKSSTVPIKVFNSLDNNEMAIYYA